MSRFEILPSPESNYDSLIEVLYATATARLDEALGLQVEGTRYFHVWEEHFHDIPNSLVAFKLAQDYENVIEEGGEHFDVILPAISLRLNEAGLLNQARPLMTASPWFIISTKKYDPAHRYIINRETIPRLESSPEPALHDLDSKLMTYKIIPFRMQEQTA